MSTLTRLKDFVLRHEGYVNHMYLDTRGKLTVGIGFLLKFDGGFFDEIKLNWKTKQGVYLPPNRFPFSVARSAQITVEIARVKAVAADGNFNRAAALYDSPNALILDPAEIESWFYKYINSKQPALLAGLQNHGIDYNTLPEDAQFVIQDIHYNTGNVFSFPTMLAAIARRDWVTAANETNRPDVSATRNREIKNLLLGLVER